jgi:hypothetical protein
MALWVMLPREGLDAGYRAAHASRDARRAGSRSHVLLFPAVNEFT